MEQYAGLDVSLKETAVCVMAKDGAVHWRGRCPSTPEGMAATLRQRAPMLERAVLESGTLSTWHWHGLRALDVPVVCVDARQAKAALSGRPHKSDDLDAEGLAQLARTEWFAEVRVKSLESHRLRSVLVARAKLVTAKRTLSNTIRSLLKTVGSFTQRARGAGFAERVRALIADEPILGRGIEGLLATWEEVCIQIKALDRFLGRQARADKVCRLLMSAPGVGTLTALAFRTVIDDPGRFRNGTEVAAYLGLVPRRQQSGHMDRMGSISRCGDPLVRSYLFEAASVAMERVKRPNAPTAWARRIVERSGLGKGRVALARKLAVTLFAMWRTETPFLWTDGTAAPQAA